MFCVVPEGRTRKNDGLYEKAIRIQVEKFQFLQTRMSSTVRVVQPRGGGGPCAEPNVCRVLGTGKGTQVDTTGPDLEFMDTREDRCRDSGCWCPLTSMAREETEAMEGRWLSQVSASERQGRIHTRVCLTIEPGGWT